MNLDKIWRELDKVPTIVFDLDGTVTNFRRIDNKIIREEIFSQNKFVIFIDRLAWSVNQIDVIKNTTIMLVLRLFVYSIFAGKNYKKVIEKYRERYISYSKEEILKNKDVILSLKEKGYHVIILSNNRIADKLYLEEAEITSVNSKYKAMKEIKKDCRIYYFIGNNLMDDIITAKRLGVRGIYIGNSPFIPQRLVYAKIKSLRQLKNIKKSGN